MMWMWNRPYLFADSGGGSAPAPTSDGGASSGSSAPSSSPASGTSPASSGESTDFEAIFDGSSNLDGDSPSSGLTEQLTAQQPAAKAPPPPAAQPQPTAPQQPTAQPQAPAQAQAPQQPQSQPAAAVPAELDRYDPAQLVNALAANEQQLTDVLATHVMKLSPQEVEALETNVVEAIPRLMARVLVQAQRSALSQMANILPVAIQRHTETMYRAANAESTFYRALPGLNPAVHGPMVYSYAAMFRQMHPQATLQDLIAHVGPMVMVAAGVQPRTPQPQAVQRAANGRSPPPSPFVPAGAGPASGSTRGAMEPWEAMFAHQD